MKRAEDEPLDPELRDALGALREEQHALTPPADVEDRVMRAWDDARRVTSRLRDGFRRGLLATAAAGLLAATLGYWWTRDANEPSTAPAMQPVVTAPWPSDETLAWLGGDPASLQVVRIRVTSMALAEHGYAVSDPDGDGLVDVEMVVGTDGIAQTVRLSPATALRGVGVSRRGPMVRQILACVAVSVACGSVLRAQREMPPPPPPIDILGVEPLDFEVVAGLPFTAEAVTEMTQELRDGNRIEQRSTTTIARDGRGRVRREQPLPLLGPVMLDSDVRMITISDPQERTVYLLDPRRRTVSKSTASAGAAAAARRRRARRAASASAPDRVGAAGRAADPRGPRGRHSADADHSIGRLRQRRTDQCDHRAMGIARAEDRPRVPAERPAPGRRRLPRRPSRARRAGG